MDSSDKPGTLLFSLHGNICASRMCTTTTDHIITTLSHIEEYIHTCTQFGRDWELSWVARNLAPIKGQKIHWRSVPGTTNIGLEVPNMGQIRFVRTGDRSCRVRLTIEYEVPSPLAPFASALTPLVEDMLLADLKKFSVIAKNKSVA